ncbi:hypothetical protein Tco_1531853 [Tanacetum coccineum]
MDGSFPTLFMFGQEVYADARLVDGVMDLMCAFLHMAKHEEVLERPTLWIDEGSAMPSVNDHRLILLQEIEKIDKFASMDIIQKAHVKWDIEGDENSKFFHGLIN